MTDGTARQQRKCAPPEFFERCVIEVARDLIGAELVWNGCGGVIVETEAYASIGDAACHTASRPSARQFIESMPPGTAYVYLNYGMYWLFNLLAKGGGKDGLVLVRALKPTSGIEVMRTRRGRESLTELCSGPGKLGRAFGLTGKDHGTPMARAEDGVERGIWMTQGGSEVPVVEDVRVGISQATDLRWRFLMKDSPFVSVPAGKVRLPAHTRLSFR